MSYFDRPFSFTYLDGSNEHLVSVRIQSSQITDNFQSFAPDFRILFGFEEVEKRLEEGRILDVRLDNVAGVFYQLAQSTQGNLSLGGGCLKNRDVEEGWERIEIEE